ncbi:MAG TPA: aspartate 1-decarboxylase [Firmicutes bacterium]|nr:aspartate 1-decarboxylase [Bacillota bacterium]HAZ21515.1 aspartate 1-decarboxylase [Bacillota bacterium]HBE05639.1 aspartate 1-decarboxylase [Bacillota bacterium]HBG45181.1 aspartate 1-decarboxylase [Bacillota bacterium]HBL50015.1 aspartate 1-decarboxylase [Bacillota bacterium]
MLLSMFKSKLHRATITQADLNYVGSVTIDRELLEKSGILPGEKVQVLNLNNGERFETYTIEGAAGSGIICINGAAARLVQVGDKVIIIAYALMDENEAKTFAPTVVVLDEKNRIVRIKHEEIHGTTE